MNTTKQVYYNQVKGVISEINNTKDFPSVTIEVGHEVKRSINICCKIPLMQEIIENHKVNDKISIKFFVSSRFKHGRWYTMANGLEVID